MSELNKVEIKVSFNTIKLIGFELTEMAENMEKQLKPSDYEYKFDISYNPNDEDKTLVVPFRMTISNRHTKDELAHIKTQMSFMLLNYDELIKSKDNGREINKGVLAMSAGVTLGTTRGMFFMCANHSILSNAIMPIVDANNFLPKDDEKK